MDDELWAVGRGRMNVGSCCSRGASGHMRPARGGFKVIYQVQKSLVRPHLANSSLCYTLLHFTIILYNTGLYCTSSRNVLLGQAGKTPAPRRCPAASAPPASKPRPQCTHRAQSAQSRSLHGGFHAYNGKNGSYDVICSPLLLP